jgi:hypothetical protein
MHKIKQTIFISPDEVREYGLSAPMAGNPVYITEEDNFLVPRLGSDLYYEISKDRREILCIRDLISRNTIVLGTVTPPEPPKDSSKDYGIVPNNRKVKPPVVDNRNWIQKLFCCNPDDYLK